MKQHFSLKSHETKKKQMESHRCLFRIVFNKPGKAQVGAISKAQKDSKTTFSTTADNKSSQKTKN